MISDYSSHTHAFKVLGAPNNALQATGVRDNLIQAHPDGF